MYITDVTIAKVGYYETIEKYGCESTGWENTTSLAMDSTKVVSADGVHVRVWSYHSGRRFAMLKAALPVTRVAMSESHLAAMEESSVRVWDIDDLKSFRVLRCPHTLADICFANNMLLAAQSTGCASVFDSATGQAPVMEMRCELGLKAVCCTRVGHVVTAGGAIGMWDMHYGCQTVSVRALEGRIVR